MGGGALPVPAREVDKKARRIVLGPGEGHEHTASIVFLHGYGDSAGAGEHPNEGRRFIS